MARNICPWEGLARERPEVEMNAPEGHSGPRADAGN
jgi:hypothetical protein